MAELKELAEQLVNLSVKDVSELANILKEEYGIEPAAAAAAVVMSSNDGPGDAAAKSEFDIILKSAGGTKLQVVKEIKNLLGVGLKEAKAVVDSAPGPVKEGVPKDEAESIKAALEALGAEVELK